MSRYLKRVNGWERFGAPTAAFLMAVVVSALLVTPAQGEGVTPIITNKSIPAATVSVIDPETGSSSGGGTTDVNIGPGDIILFQMTLTAVPDNSVRGVQSYVTDFIPANTEVVGIRVIDASGLTIPPNVYGLAPDDCGINCNSYNAVPCSSGTCNLDDGSIAQLYHDTGIWYSTSTDLLRYPDTSFIGLEAGRLLGTNPDKDTPNLVDGIASLVSKSTSDYYAHSFWDLLQVYGFGTADAPVGNSGIGNTPWGYGSPVAGPDTHYPYEASVGALVGGTCSISHDCDGVLTCGTSECVCVASECYQIEYNDQNGPWERIYYPGSLTTDLSGVPTGKGADPQRSIVVPNQSGWYDVTPNNPLPWNAVGAKTTAVRLALGELRVGREVTVEIALRVIDTPLDPVQNSDVNCSNVMPAEIAATGSNQVTNNPWAFHLPTAACLYLNLLFDVTADRLIASGGDPINETVTGKNLSTNPQTGAVLELRYSGTRQTYTGVFSGTIAGLPAPAPTVTTCGGFDCLVWSLGDLQPSDEYEITAGFTAGGGGGIGAAVYANYTSNQLPAPGFTTLAVTAIKNVALTNAVLDWTAPLPFASAGSTATLTGTITNDGNQAANYDTVELLLPASWTIASATLGGDALTCAAPINNLASCDVPGSVDDFAIGQLRPLVIVVNIPGGTPADLYDIDLAIRGTQSAQWKPFEMYYRKVTAVSVGEPRSDEPAIDCPVDKLDTTITGTSTEADGTVVTIYFNGYPRGTATVTGGVWSFTGYDSTFGELYAGLEVRVTAEAGSETVSELSAACSVSTTPTCSDGIDNDGDGLTDFPADPGCSSPLDGSEDDPAAPECSDGADNDGDGDTDWPADTSCSSPTDNSEGGLPECSDGIDNDGDGNIDFPADTGCDSATDSNEILFRECQDLIDNGDLEDGVADFLTDPGCHSWNDDDETDFTFPSDIYARLLVVFDTSGSMNWNACDPTFTGGDGSSACGGDDVLCGECNASGCGDGLPNDSRLYKVKDGISDAVTAYGSVEWGLMRFHQRAMGFQCPTTNASLQSGGWQGAGAAPCGGGFNAGDLLVGYSPENAEDMLEWMDHDSNYPGTPPAGMDFELRGSGTTPLAGSLTSAQTYITGVQASDPAAACRPYRVILVTDGGETCGGDPSAAAAALNAAGIPVHVIGFATSDVAIINSLNAIAASGGTSSAVFADDEVSLSAAIASIISDSILVEICNDLDDDCDSLVDEDFPDKGDTCTNGELGICNLPGVMVCRSDGLGTECDAPAGVPGTEVCNGLDDDCNGLVDEGGVCAGPEICNGVDDYGDGWAGHPEGSEDPRVGQVCGTNVGACATGLTYCWQDSGDPSIVEIRCSDTGPVVEVCDADVPANDQNCNGVNNDGVAPRACQNTNTYGTCTGMEICDVAGNWVNCSAPWAQPETCNNNDDDCDGTVDEALTRTCQVTNGFGTCLGTETCALGAWGGCSADTPAEETCNGLDDDCDGVVDEGLSRSCSVTVAGIGTCDGVEVCTAGSWGGCTAATPATESCNGLDDDCDGTTDENLDQACYSGPASTQNVGLCVGGTRSCIGGAYGACIGEVTPVAEICDLADNDCNNVVDDGLGQTTCGLGTCQHTVDNCVNGVSQTCDPFQGATPETCDGADNDCDGVTDGLNETCYGFTSGCAEVGGVWSCQGTCTTGVRNCPAGGGGVWGSCAGDVGPGNELCDGLDNDCDGTVDSFNQACYPGGYGATTGCTAPGVCVGACSEGSQTCTAGAWGSCSGPVTPIPETCNNVDDDCDGQTDEGLSQSCQETNGFGTCTGTQTCATGSWSTCTAATPAAETCNNVDDDCDGAVDEGLSQTCYGGPAGTQGVGICTVGTETCTTGTWGNCVGEVTPGTEVCDGLDNDCDGLTDEDAGGNPLTQPCYTGPTGTDGVGICVAGTRTCGGGSWGACIGEVVPQTETCDGLDNNCNNQVDENLGTTTCGLGACQHTVDNCVAGVPQTCDPLQGAQVETCDGVDNDCDGVADGLQRSCYTHASGCAEPNPGVFNCQGACAPGLDVCAVGGGGTWSGCQFDVGPNPEICDNLDNDCDGQVDEDAGGGPLTEACYSPGSGPNTGCTFDASTLSWSCLGECNSGTRTCAVGVWGQCAGEVTPAVETCNTLDDDCDGETDEATDIPGLNQPCGNALGRCTPGILLCINGAEVCQGGDGPFPGECNLQDDDCDGEVDEPDEVVDGSGLPCGDTEGACEPGHTECIGGTWECVDEVLASQEVCDGIDNDCDGVVDNGDLCPEDYYCVEVNANLTECRPGCRSGEFPCDPGDICEENVPVGTENVDICMPDLGSCDPPCPAGQECDNGVCVDPCEGVSCNWWEECDGGACIDRSCTGIGQGCPPDEFCLDHVCVDDPCNEADCEQDEYCIPQCDENGCTGAACEPLCYCEEGMVCDGDGGCLEDVCADVQCDLGQRCNPDTGNCEEDPCAAVAPFCDPSETCYEGECIDDPCGQIECPPTFLCVLVETTDELGDPVQQPVCAADPSTYIPGIDGDSYLATGDGGCACQSSSDGRGAGLFALLMLLFLWRRRRRARAQRNRAEVA